MADFDKITNPSHYNAGRRYEPRKVVEDWGLDFYLGNALKYICRAGRKGDAIEDLQKAKQCIDFEIERLEEEREKAEEEARMKNRAKAERLHEAINKMDEFLSYSKNWMY